MKNPIRNKFYGLLAAPALLILLMSVTNSAWASDAHPKTAPEKTPEPVHETAHEVAQGTAHEAVPEAPHGDAAHDNTVHDNTAHDTPLAATEAPCGVLDEFGGDVQILGTDKTHLILTQAHAPIPCGAWVSVELGWAKIRHQNGQAIHLGERSFVQLPRFQETSNANNLNNLKGDHLLMYKGEAYVEVTGGAQEFRIASSNARARIEKGKTLFLFNTLDNETQLISLENSASLENRFEPSRKIKIQAGEVTTLNFRLVRVVPSLPSAISVATLKPKLALLNLSEDDQFDAVRTVIKRLERKFASELVSEDESSLVAVSKPIVEPGKNHSDSEPLLVGGAKRVPAGAKVGTGVGTGVARSPGSKNGHNYLRHSPDEVDTYLQGVSVGHIAGGEQVGEEILYPDRFYGRAQRIHLDIHDSTRYFNEQKQKDAEKKRLMDELSRLRME